MARSATIFVTLLAAHWAAAAPPTADDVRRWVRDLDDPRYRVRDAASKQLLAAGPSSVEALLSPAASADAEVADRAFKILAEMADSEDGPTQRVARDALRKLAEGSGRVSATAAAVLKKRKQDYAGRLTTLGARLEFDGDEVTDIDLDGVKEMAAATALLGEFPETKYLSASTKMFDDTAAKSLVLLPNLEAVNLYQSALGDEGLKTISTLKKLRRLPMGQTKVTDAGLKTIGGMTQLEYVGVRGNNVTDAGIKHLRPLKNLTGLNLGETRVTDAGIAELTAFPKMQQIYLQETNITDACLSNLVVLKGLEMLTLYKTRITFEGRAKLKTALPALEITDEGRDDAP